MNNLISDSQHGFSHKSHNLASLHDFLAQIIDKYGMDNKNTDDLTYLDFEKAYDKVNGKMAKSSIARSLPVENLLPENVRSIINNLQ